MEGPVVLSHPQRESESSTRADEATPNGKGQEKGEQQVIEGAAIPDPAEKGLNEKGKRLRKHDDSQNKTSTQERVWLQ